jgi:hypothetical protein
MRHAEGRLLVQRAVGGNYMNSTMRKSQHPNSPMFWGLFLHCITEVHIMCTHTYIIKSYQMYDYVSLHIDK